MKPFVSLRNQFEVTTVDQSLGQKQLLGIDQGDFFIFRIMFFMPYCIKYLKYVPSEMSLLLDSVCVCVWGGGGGVAGLPVECDIMIAFLQANLFNIR